MNLFAHFLGRVEQALSDLAAEGLIASGLDHSRVVAEPPRDPSHGDVSTNAAMVLAKAAGMSPRKLAELLCSRLGADADVAAAEIAGPGFINLKLKPTIWPKLLASIVTLKNSFGHSTLGKGEKVNVEYVSANPTGPLHVGHCRGAVFGDALAALLTATGYDVTKEYYINDAGAQVDTLARSAHLRYREALGERIDEIPAGLYPGDYLKAVGQALAAEHGAKLHNLPESDWLEPVRAKAIAMMLDLIREDLAALNIRQEVFFSEKSLHTSGAVDETLATLEKAGHVYKGRLDPPKGEVPEDWEDREQTLFRATSFGDDVDRPLKKSDGSFTYFASDVAYSRDKISRGFKQLIYILGADHGGYVKRLQAVASAIAGEGKVQVIVRLCQLVKLFRNGEPVRMSKRAGEFVTLRDVVDEVGADVVRFMMLFRKNEAPLDFDFAKVTEQSKDNPVFYVQYAHARICSVLRNAAAEGFVPASAEEAQFNLLTDETEMAVIKRMAAFPRLMESAALAHEPHRISFYLYDLASDFHALWNKGKEAPHLRFIIPAQRQLTMTRMAFLDAIRYSLANGLNILGVRPVEEM
ncbi:MAG: arginine--tRNA ligase [Phyllobacteriaceae bacterium]|nr:arginine--tRNA ligase [Phyllobacteriaceae bacterium]